MAADEAYRAGAFAEVPPPSPSFAAELSQQALALGDQVAPGHGNLRLARRHLVLGQAKFNLGRVADSRRSLERCLRLLDFPAADKAPVLRGSISTMMGLLWRGPAPKSQAKKAKKEEGDDEEEARRVVLSRALAQYVVNLVHMGDVLGGLYFSLRNAKIAVADVGSPEYGEACGFLYLGLRTINMEKQARRWLAAGKAAAATPRGRPAVPWLYVHQSGALICTGELEAAHALCTAGVDEIRRRGDVVLETMLMTNIAYTSFLLGPADEPD
eukprot:tig00000459_g1062.t1